MAETVWMAVWHLGLFAQAGDQLAQHAFVHGAMHFAQEQWRAWFIVVFATGQIAPQCAPRRLAQVYDAALAAFGAALHAMLDLDPARLLVDVADCEGAQFGRPQPG